VSIRGLEAAGEITIPGLQRIPEGEGNRVGGRNANKGIKQERFRDCLKELCGGMEELNENGRVWTALQIENLFCSQVCVYIGHGGGHRNSKDTNTLSTEHSLFYEYGTFSPSCVLRGKI